MKWAGFTHVDNVDIPESIAETMSWCSWTVAGFHLVDVVGTSIDTIQDRLAAKKATPSKGYKKKIVTTITKHEFTH